MNKFIIIVLTIFVVSAITYGLVSTAHSPTITKSNFNQSTDSETKALPITANLQLQEQLDKSNLQSKSYLIYREDTGQVLAAKAIDNPISIASLTKLMTALVIIEGADMDEIYEVRKEGLVYINPILRLQTGDRVKVSDLVKSILVGSANDAALSLGLYYEQSTGQNIIEAMNEKAAKLEMSATRFNNPIGFDSDTNYSSAIDIQKLLIYINRYPVFAEVGRMNFYSFQSELENNYSVEATNKLIRQFSDLEAVKTGFTNDANGAMVVKLKTDPKTVIIVLKSANREMDVSTIRREILKFYQEFQK